MVSQIISAHIDRLYHRAPVYHLLHSPSHIRHLVASVYNGAFLPSAQQQILLAYRGTLILGALAAFVAYFAGWAVYSYYFHPLRQFPGPKLARASSAWIIWKVLLWDRSPALHKAMEEYGDFVRVAPNTLVTKHEAAPATLYTSGTGSRMWKAKWYTGFYVTQTYNAMCLVNPHTHLNRKRLMRAAYSTPKNKERMHHHMEEKAFALVRYLRTNGNDGQKPFECLKLFRHFMLDTLTGIIYGVSTDILKTNRVLDFTKYVDLTVVWMLVKGYFNPFFFFSMYLNPLAWPMFYAKYKIDEFVTNLYFQSKALWEAGAFPEDDNLVQQLLESTDPETLKHPDDETVKAEAGIHIFAGSDTTATALSYVCWELARKPHVAQRLYDELHNEGMPDSGKAPDSNQLANLPYLNAVARETLRLYCPAPSELERVVPKGGVDVGGTFIPEGTVIGIQSHTQHRQTDIFYNPEEFIPERWLEDDGPLKKALMPYGLGVRTCAGWQAADMGLRIALAVISRNFTIEVDKQTTDESMRQIDLWLNAPVSHAVHLKFHPRPDAYTPSEPLPPAAAASTFSVDALRGFPAFLLLTLITLSLDWSITSAGDLTLDAIRVAVLSATASAIFGPNEIRNFFLRNFGFLVGAKAGAGRPLAVPPPKMVKTSDGKIKVA